MDDESGVSEEIRAAYAWAPGDCFRCGFEDVMTAALGSVGPADERVVLRACGVCVTELEADREAAATRAGLPYAPGGITVG